MGRFKNRFISALLTKFPWLFEKSFERVKPLTVEGIPWAPFTKKLKDSTIAIVTTAGVHLKSQPPFDMHDPQGDPTYRELPLSTQKSGYTITHDYYDHRDADRDMNVVFPIDRMSELKEAGFIGGLAPINYGFMGHIDGRHVETLIKKTAPEVAGKLKKQRVDAVLLTPG